jgi:hypothetical protein
MAAISVVFTVGHVATLLGEDEDWLLDLSICQIASNHDPHFAFNRDPSEAFGLGLSM